MSERRLRFNRVRRRLNEERPVFPSAAFKKEDVWGSSQREPVVPEWGMCDYSVHQSPDPKNPSSSTQEVQRIFVCFPYGL